MKPVGFARYLSRLASSQVTFASFVSEEKSYPGTEALLLPTMPASDGPTPFLPGCVEWQATQTLANTVWPAEDRISPAVGSSQRAMRRDQSVGDAFRDHFCTNQPCPEEHVKAQPACHCFNAVY